MALCAPASCAPCAVRLRRAARAPRGGARTAIEPAGRRCRRLPIFPAHSSQLTQSPEPVGGTGHRCQRRRHRRVVCSAHTHSDHSITITCMGTPRPIVSRYQASITPRHHPASTVHLSLKRLNDQPHAASKQQARSGTHPRS